MATTVSFDNLVLSVNESAGITLASGVSYTAGMVVVLQDTGKYTNADVALAGADATSPNVTFDAQKVYVLSDDYDATDGDVAAIAYTGEFNSNNITLPGTQTEATIGGILQAKGIILKKGNK